MTETALTDQDYERIRLLAETDARSLESLRPDPDDRTVECHKCGYTWEYTGNRERADCPKCRARPKVVDTEDGRGLTTPMCNAIRCAAEDGKSYRGIADLFNFLSSTETARLHAIGECSHEAVEYPPIDQDRDSGFGHCTISRDRCELLRRRYNRGGIETYTEAGEAVGLHRTTAARHIRGECNHNTSEDDTCQ